LNPAIGFAINAVKLFSAGPKGPLVVGKRAKQMDNGLSLKY